MKARLEFTDMTTAEGVCLEYDCFPGASTSPFATCIMQAKVCAFEEGYCLDLDLDFKIFINDKEML